MKRLLTVLAPGKELLKIFRVFILGHNNFLWFTSIATICHAFISLLKLKVESILVPVINVLISRSTTEYSDVMRGWIIRASDRYNTCFVYRESKFIL